MSPQLVDKRWMGITSHLGLRAEGLGFREYHHAKVLKTIKDTSATSLLPHSASWAPQDLPE